VREVHEDLAATKDVGYTTTLKLMQIMNEKGLVKRDDSMRTHVYQAAVNKEKTQKHLLGKMIDNLFGGSPTQLVIQALGEHKASPDELEKIILKNNKNVCNRSIQLSAGIGMGCIKQLVANGIVVGGLPISDCIIQESNLLAKKHISCFSPFYGFWLVCFYLFDFID
jgi:predicted transcriptional regulator